MSAMCPTRRSPSTHSAYASNPRSRSPLAQYARPKIPAAAGADEVVIRRRKLERAAGVGHGADQIAVNQCQRRPVRVDRAGQAAKARLVDDDHTRRCRASLSVMLQPPLGVSQPLLDALELAGQQERPGKAHGQHGPNANHLSGKHLQPTTHRRLLPSLSHRSNRELGQVRRPVEIAGGERMTDRFSRFPAPLEPATCPAVQRRDLAGLFIEQVRPQHIGEEMVVAIPATAVIQRDQEQVRPLQHHERRSAVRLTGDRIAQRPAQAVENRGLQEETAGHPRAGAAGPPRRGSPRCTGRLRRNPQ